jgi:hypothetical protein
MVNCFLDRFLEPKQMDGTPAFILSSSMAILYFRWEPCRLYW